MHHLRLILALLIISLPSSGYAAEAAEASQTPWWVPALGAVLVAVVGWLARLWSKKAGAETKKAEIDAEKSLWEQRNHLIDTRITPFLISTAEHWLITNIPVVLEDLSDGDGLRWEDHWTNLRNYTKNRALRKFTQENIDLVERLGEQELDNLLDRLLLKLIGKLPDSVQAFMPKELVEQLNDLAAAFVVAKSKELFE